MTEGYEERARETFRGWLEAYDAVVPKVELDDPSHKWRATSAWQKAIRRGDRETARRALAGLWALNPRYVLYRLPVILLEDVGWGHPELMQVGMVACGRRGWGGDPERMVSMITDMAVAAVKDRTSCDLAVATDRLFVVDPRVKEILLLPSTVARVDMLQDTARTPFERMAALWSLAGTDRFPQEHVMTPYSVVREELDAIVDALHPAGHDAWRIGASRMKNAMPLAALLTGEYVSHARSVWVEEEPIPPEADIGGYPASSFDWFTREGRKAITDFMRVCAPWREWLAQFVGGRNDQRVLTARFLFRVESGLLGRRLRYEPWSPIITRMPLQAAASAHGLTTADVDHGKRLLARSLAELIEVRQEVADR